MMLRMRMPVVMPRGTRRGIGNQQGGGNEGEKREARSRHSS